MDLKRKEIYYLGSEFKGKVIFTAMIDELFNYVFGVLPYRSLRFEVENLNTGFFQEVAVVNYPNDYEYTRIAEYKHIHPSDTSFTTIIYEYPESYELGKIPYYPVFTKEALDSHEKYLELASRFKNLVVVGRFAEYRYYDMDDVIKRALEIFVEFIS